MLRIDREAVVGVLDGEATREEPGRDLVDRYRARLAEWSAEIASFVARRGGTYVQVPSDLDLADLLFDVLRRRRVVE